MTIALLLSGGTGNRFGADIPKQYLRVKDKILITYCLETLIENNRIDAIQIVAEESWQNVILEELQKQMISIEKIKGFSLPGKNRQWSIYYGLEDILQYAGKEDAVLVHDAARPLLSNELIMRCLNALSGHDGVMPVLPVKDTMYLTKEGGRKIDGLLNRQKVVAGQAPETYLLGKYYAANRSLIPDELDGITGSTEPAVKAGMDMVLVQGEEQNFKITTKSDLERFCQIISDT